MTTPQSREPGTFQGRRVPGPISSRGGWHGWLERGVWGPS